MSKVVVENIQKVFNPHSRNCNQVLKGVSFELPEKGLVAIYGKSGSGKTTLLNIIGGLDRQDGGKIYIDGECTTGKVDHIRNAKIGFIFQNYYLERGYTISEIMRNQMIIAGFTDEEEIAKRTSSVLKLVDMERFKNKQGDALSGGQQQRVAIARAIIKGSDIILADEPTGNLDSENTTKVMDILKEISKTQLVVIVTHELSLIEKYADSYIKIVDGKLVNESEIADTVEYLSESNTIKVNPDSATKIKQGGINVNFYGKTEEESNIEIITDNGNIYLKAGKNVKIIDENSEKKIVFAGKDINDVPEKKELPPLEQFTKSKSKRNGRLFSFKKVLSSISANEEEKIYSTANIFKQIFIFAMAIVMCFFSFSIFEVFNTTIENKALEENTAYVKLGTGTYEMLRNTDESKYTNIDFFETDMREGSFSFNNIASLSGIKEKYTPKAINSTDTFENLYGKMPQEKEILISRELAERLKKDLREQDLENDRSLLLMIFNEDFRISGIVDGKEPIIYMNKIDYINFLGVYSQLQFADRQNYFLTSDYVNNMFSAEICVASSAKKLEKNQVAVEINRNSLYKMMKDTTKADYIVEEANAKLSRSQTAIYITGSKPMYVREFMVVRQDISTDVKIYISESALENIFMYISPNFDVLGSTNYFKIQANSEEALSEVINQPVGRLPVVNIESIYEQKNADIISEASKGLGIFVVMAILLYCIYYFVEKSGSVKNSKEYGIYRAIGVNRSNLLFKETIISLFTNILSYLLFSVIISIIICARYSVINVAFGGFILLSLGIFALSSVIMIGISLIPYLFVIYKTPAQILASYDI